LFDDREDWHLLYNNPLSMRATLTESTVPVEEDK